ncbi:MAG: hypothetical protein JWM16_3873 [Verrucomicrobiales bacterium]|nr:hypothetical protein [Verrucomicrobiales bacterium]
MLARSTEFHLRLSSRLFDYALAVLSVLFIALVHLTLKPMIESSSITLPSRLPLLSHYGTEVSALLFWPCFWASWPAVGFFSLHGRAFD